MTGLLVSQGLRVSQQRVGESLSRVNPGYQHACRTATARQMNPIPYRADYFGHKLHIDQNEKLVMFGVTHICAVDAPVSTNNIVIVVLRIRCKVWVLKPWYGCAMPENATISDVYYECSLGVLNQGTTLRT